MRAIRKILVAVKEPSAPSLPAVDKAAQLARAFGASLELYHSVTEKVLVDPYFNFLEYTRDFERETEQRYRDELQALADKLSRQGLKATANVDWDYPPHEALVRQARRHDIDLIVAECHAAARKTAPWMLHLTDWELLRTSPLPVLLIKNSVAWTRPVVLAAVDPAHSRASSPVLDLEILRQASTLSDTLDGSLQVMHSFVPLPPSVLMGIGASGISATEVAEEAQRRARKLLQRTLRRFGQTQIPRHLVEGKAADTIPAVARDIHCGILVMGAISRSGLKRVFIGNTAERVLDALPCDVLVVKPASFRSRVPERGRGIRYVGATSWRIPQ
jgi:universal stress protein E